jgi:S-adenosylmethionine synthetase
LKPASIIKDLDLRRPIYSRLASYGHFGRNDLELTWRNTDKTEEILAAANQYLK